MFAVCVRGMCRDIWFSSRHPCTEIEYPLARVPGLEVVLLPYFASQSLLVYI